MSGVRLVAITLGLALAGCGVGADQGRPPTDGGARFDLAFAGDGGNSGVDLGELESDLGAPVSFTIALVQPAPLASLVPTNAELDFDVQLAGASESQVESSIVIAAKTGGGPIAGGFVWQQSSVPGHFDLRFLPSATLTDDTDWLVTAQDAGQIVLATGFSTGSHPRVSAVTLTIAGSATTASVEVDFSEPVAGVSNATSVLANGTAVPLSPTTSTTQQFHFDVTGGPTALANPIALQIAATGVTATAAGSAPLDAQDWASPTKQADGSFLATLPAIDLAHDGATTWTPAVK